MANDWTEKTLGDFVALQRGHDLTEPDRRLGRIPVMGSAGQNGFHDTALARGPGIVIGRSGASFGQVHFCPTDYWPHNTGLYVTDFKGNDPRFAFYFLKAIDFDRYNSGSAQPSLNRNFIYPIPVRVPEPAEQRAIANIVGVLDDKIELNRRMNETLEGLARAIFQSWFVDFDPVRAQRDGLPPPALSPATASLFPDSFEDSELGKIPKGWRIETLGDHVDLQRGKTYKSKLKELPGPYLLGLASIGRNGGFRSDKLVTYGGDCPKNLLVYPGDLFVSLKDVTQSADLLGSVARFPSQFKLGRLTQDTVKLIFKDGAPSRNLVYRTLMTPEYRAHCRAHATGTTNLGLARNDFLWLIGNFGAGFMKSFVLAAVTCPHWDCLSHRPGLTRQWGIADLGHIHHHVL